MNRWTIGGAVAVLILLASVVTYAVDTRKDASQALLDIKGHGALPGHADTVPRLATIEAVLLSLAKGQEELKEAALRSEARLYDLQVRLLGRERNELVEPF